MNKWMISAAIATVLPFASMGQAPGTAFQYVFTGAGSGENVTVKLLGGMKSKVVTGRPLSATEEHHTLQVLGDGTRIETKSSDKYYRDDQGRTRVEREDGTVLIDDPVQGAGAEISGKVVRRSTYANDGNGSRSFSFTTSDTPDRAKAKAEVDAVQAKLQGDLAAKLDKQKAEAAAKAESRNEENLGFQMVNGTSAQGTRTTTSIPLGQIGNDRPIGVVSERWFSPDLQMLIKSTNNDPRFGETTYELTNIVQGPPDPSLFQIPAK